MWRSSSRPMTRRGSRNCTSPSSTWCVRWLRRGCASERGTRKSERGASETRKCEPGTRNARGETGPSVPRFEFRLPRWGGVVIDLSGKRAFVTGGGRGIGRATALLLARAGPGVAVGYRSRRAEADETLAGGKRLRRPAIGVAGDLGAPAAAGRAVDDAGQGLGGLDLLIWNHGIWPPGQGA